jgi:hypothetical protein
MEGKADADTKFQDILDRCKHALKVALLIVLFPCPAILM